VYIDTKNKNYKKKNTKNIVKRINSSLRSESKIILGIINF